MVSIDVGDVPGAGLSAVRGDTGHCELVITHPSRIVDVNRGEWVAQPAESARRVESHKNKLSRHELCENGGAISPFCV